ncbi:MAG: hypothetical protein AUJ60_09045 [Nitrospirae bacterium CG1_02_44_142]|nr:MAG: hypothetical protein AUJ60_09045 [Nitrospirae bacterium CG1_02_44_142]
MKIQWEESRFCRVILLLLGITLFLGIYTAFTVPLVLATKLPAMWFGGISGGVLLMIVYHRVIMVKYRGGFSEASTAGQLCVSFILFMLTQYEASKYGGSWDHNYQAVISILMVVISLMLYIYQKIKGKSLQQKNLA